MRILALDLGAKMGWAFAGTGGEISSGEWQLPGDRPQRLASLWCALNHFIAMEGVQFVIYERPFARGQHATRSLWGMAGVIEACCHKGQRCAVGDVHNSSWKKYIHGTSKVTKQMTLDWLRIRGTPTISDNEADAVAILIYAIDNRVEG